MDYWTTQHIHHHLRCLGNHYQMKHRVTQAIDHQETENHIDREAHQEGHIRE